MQQNEKGEHTLNLFQFEITDRTFTQELISSCQKAPGHLFCCSTNQIFYHDKRADAPAL